MIDDGALIGGRERTAIVICDYDPGWAVQFEAERSRVAGALGARVLIIEHVGSTSVAGLAAKPVVDLVAVVELQSGVELEVDGEIVRLLEGAGYELRVREPGHLMFRTPALDVHVHVHPDGDPEVARLLAFREALRASPEERAAYEQLKRELASRVWEDMNEYADAKTELIDGVLARVGAPRRSTL